MTDEDYASAQVLKSTIQKLTAAQTSIGASGVRVHIRVTNADGSQELLSSKDLVSMLTQNTYDTICATAKTTINTDLGTAKTTAQTSFTALGTGG